MEKFIVVTRTFFDDEYKTEVLDLADKTMPIFKKQPGLISIRMHVNHEQNQTMTYFEWQTKEDHENCMQSPDFNNWNPQWEKLIQTGRVQWELHTYDVIDEFVV